jgi:hypothetical protein
LDPRIIYLKEGDRLGDFRAILSPLVVWEVKTAMYAEAQEGVMRDYMKRHAKECQTTGKPIDARVVSAAASSQESFIGPYLNMNL